MKETLQMILKILVTAAIPLAAFVTGLRAARMDPLWLVKRPGLLLRSLLAILIVVPVGAVVFLQAIHAAPVVRAGLTMAVLAIGIGPPTAFRRAKAAEETISFEVSLNVLLLALAIVYLPAAVALHGAIFHHALRLAPGRVAVVVVTRALGPLLIGILVARLAPRAVAPIGRYAGAFVMAVLAFVVVVALVATHRALIGLGASAWLTCAAVAVGEIVVGHLSGGPEWATRRVLAAFSAVRFPALALLLTSLVPQGKTLVPVILAYVIVSALAVALYSAIASVRSRQGRALTPFAGAAPTTESPA